MVTKEAKKKRVTKAKITVSYNSGTVDVDIVGDMLNLAQTERILRAVRIKCSRRLRSYLLQNKVREADSVKERGDGK